MRSRETRGKLESARYLIEQQYQLYSRYMQHALTLFIMLAASEVLTQSC